MLDNDVREPLLEGPGFIEDRLLVGKMLDNDVREPLLESPDSLKIDSRLAKC